MLTRFASGIPVVVLTFCPATAFGQTDFALRYDDNQAAKTTDQPAAHNGKDKPDHSTSIFGLDAAPIDEPLITDRPDFTESTEAVPWGRFQLEAGYTFTYDREGSNRLRDHTLPEFLLRVGIVEDFELRLGWAGYSFTEEHFAEQTAGGRTVGRDDWSQGANDFEVGFKLKIAEQDGILPHLAILGGMSVPTGSANVSSGDVEPSLGLLWAYDLTDEIALAGQGIIATPTEDGDRFVQSAASVSLGVALTERWGAYVEYFGFYPNADNSDSAHTINGGVTYLVDNNFQIDLRAGFGLNEEADDFFTGVGFAWRF